MNSEAKIKIKLVIFQPDPRRQKNYAAVVLANQNVTGEWYIQERTLEAKDLVAFKEEFRWKGARHGFEYSDNPPLVVSPNF